MGMRYEGRTGGIRQRREDVFAHGREQGVLGDSLDRPKGARHSRIDVNSQDSTGLLQNEC